MIVSGKKFREQITGFVNEHVEASEQVRVIVPWVQTGPVFLSYASSTMNSRYSLWPLVFRVRYYSLALTDQRVLLIRRGRRNGQPVDVEWAMLPQLVSVPTYRKTPRSRVIGLLANDVEIQLAVRPLFFDEADAFVSALAGPR